jgi:arylsulfatase A-like enzyme
MWTGFESGNPASGDRYQDPYINTPQKGSRTYAAEFGPDIYTDHLINFMRQHKDEPMCLYYPMALVHPPQVSTPDEPEATVHIDKHKAMVRYVDKLVGRLVSALDELGIRERTIVIFTTDNGTVPGVTGTLNGLRVKGAKGSAEELDVCGPFIVNCPGIVPEGVETEALTDLSDLLPTFVELGGGETPGDLVIDGNSIAPLILGKEKDTEREWIMALGFGAARLTENGVRGEMDFEKRVIRDKRYKVWVSREKKIIRLHDLKKDPWEKSNLLDSDLAVHKKALHKFQTVVDSLPDKDAHPLYEPRASNPWDMKLSAK